MIKSMTGFGRSAFDTEAVKILAEVKTLNAKYLDINLRLPKGFSDREMEVRNLISEVLERGKITVSVDYEQVSNAPVRQTYNEELFVAYYTELKRLADRVYAPYENLFPIALNAPDVIRGDIREEGTEDEWKKVLEVLKDALAKCDRYRIDEGKALEEMLAGCCHSILQNLEIIETLDPKRIERIRERLRGNVASFFGDEGFDSNRLEQEIIFYIEKLDITEEKVRLRSHIRYFLEVLREPQSNGKKLGFISQEIGREINTIGSKSSDADIQKYVVLMKEELEKIKEQLSNVL